MGYAKAKGFIFWTSINFKFEYFINEETECFLNDTMMNFHDWHLTWLSQLKTNVRVGQFLKHKILRIDQTIQQSANKSSCHMSHIDVNKS